jgi:hypothetical protein
MNFNARLAQSTHFIDERSLPLQSAGNRSHPPEAAADKGGAGMRIVADLR